MKKTFILYSDQKEIIDKLSDEQAGMLIKAIYQYVTDGTIPKLDALIEIVFIPFKQALDRNNESWENIKSKRSIAGKIGAEKRWGKDSKKNDDIANAIFANSKMAVNVSVNDNVNVNDNVIDNDINNTNKLYLNNKVNNTNSVCVYNAPTLEEIQSYCLENGFDNFDCENFFDYYESIGWDGVKNWKAKLRYWVKNDKKKSEQKYVSPNQGLYEMLDEWANKEDDEQ